MDSRAAIYHPYALPSMQLRLGALDGAAVLGPLLAAAPREALQQLAALDATSSHRWVCCCAV